MSTITALRFDLTSNWSGKGADAAQKQLAAIKTQIEDLSSKKVQIAAETADVTAKIADVKRQIADLNGQIKLGVDDSGAAAQMATLKAQLDDLSNRKLTLRVDKTQADAEIAALKLKLDSIRSETVKIHVDSSAARADLVSAKADFDSAATDMSNSWDRATRAGQAATGNIWQALTMLLPAIVPLSAAILAFGAATVTAFATAGIAVGAFGFSVSQTIKAASTIVTQTAALNKTLTSQKNVLAGLKPGTAAYNAELKAMKTTQAELNATMAQGTPVQQQVAKHLMLLKGAWQTAQNSMEKATGPLIMKGLDGINFVIQAMVPLVTAVAHALGPLADQWTRFTQSGSGDGATMGAGLKNFVSWISFFGIPILKDMIATVEHIGTTLVQVAETFIGQGGGIAAWFAKVTGELDKWGQGGGFIRFAALVQAQGPSVKAFLESLGLAIQKVVAALSSMGGTSLSTLSIMLDLLGHLPVGAVQGFFIAFAAYKVIALTTAAISTMVAVVKGVQVAYEAAKMAVLGFQAAQIGMKVATEDGTAALIGARVALVGQAIAAVASKIATIAVSIASKVAAVAQWLWNAALTVFDVLSSPIVLLIGAIVIAVAALGFGVYELVVHWTGAWHAIMTAFKAAWTGMQTAFDAVVAFLQGKWGAFVLAIPVVGFMIYIAANWKRLWNDIQNYFSNTINAIKSAWDTVSGALKGAWDSFWSAIESTAKGVWNSITSGLSTFFGGITSGFQGVVDSVKSIWNTIEGIFTTPVNFIIRIWNDVAGVLGLPKLTAIGASTSSQGAATANAGTAASNHAGVVGHAAGGHITGPGGPRDDVIPALLSNGEYVMNAGAVSHYGVDAMHAMNAQKFSIGGFVGGLVHSVGSIASGAWDTLKSIAATAVYDTAKPMVDGVVNGVPNPIPGIPAPAGSVPHGGLQYIGDAILNKLKASQSSAQSAQKALGGTIPTAQHKSLIDQALAKAGVSQSQWATWEAGLNTLITRESGWNPSAINLTDSNAKAGHPSQGLMQTIPSTFAAYSLGGSITDPLSNIVAGIRYIMATYGGIGNVQQANANLPAKGYDMGGPLLPGLTLANNMTGVMEAVLNPTGLAAVGGLDSVSSLNSGGGFTGSTSAPSGHGGGGTFTINAPITIHAPGGNAKDIANAVEEKFEELVVLVKKGAGSR